MARTDDFIPFHRAYIDEQDIAEVVSALRSGWITTGPKVAEFEREFAAYVGAPFAVGVNSCTAAMHLAVAALGLAPGDEVITTPYTFVATSEVILYMGGKPVFVDVLPDDANIDPDQIERAITPRTKGIMPVHIAGFPVKMDRVTEIARKHGLWVVEDAAHALETQYLGRLAGRWGTVGAYSFYATKNITSAEGGMLVTDDRDIADRARILSLHGLSRDAWKRYTSTGSWYYEVVAQGYKYNLTDVLAALGLSQLRKVEPWLVRRTDYAAAYSAAFSQHPALVVPTVPADTRLAWHLYPLRLRLDRLRIGRGEFIERLRQRGIGTSVHFIPLHLHPYYREQFGYANGQFPRAEAFYEAEISLPLYPALTADQVERIADTVREIADESLT